MEKKIGFIGCGNMGTAMIQGILESGKCPPQEMMISCRTKKTLEEKKAQFGVQISTDNRDVAAFADILFVAVKPQFLCRSVRGNQGSSYRRADSGIHRAGKDTGMV